MSHVTNVMLHAHYTRHDCNIRDPESPLSRLNRWLAAQGHREMSKIETGHIAGTRHFEADLWAVACNYLDEAAFCAFFRSLPWSSPDTTQLFVKGQHAETFDVRLAAKEAPELTRAS